MIITQWNKLARLKEKREKVILLIEKSGKMNDDIYTLLMNAETVQEIEDIYLPFKQRV